MSKTRREFIDLWIAVAILMFVVGYHLSIYLFGGIGEMVDTNSATFIANGLFIWLVGLMWIAYQRWKGITRKQAILDDIISSTGLEVVMVVDNRGCITMCNDAVSLVFGYKVDEVIGRDAALLYDPIPADHPKAKEKKDSLARIGYYRGELAGRKKDGESIILEVATATRKLGDGFVQIVQDITERKQAEEGLRIAKEAAEAATEAKKDALLKLEASYRRLRELEIHRDNLIHMVCHDMKAPLQVLILQLDILKDMVIEKLDNDELESVDTLLAYSRQLELMVHSMLDLSKLENGKLPMRIKSYVVEDSIEESLTFVRSMGGDCKFVFNPPQGQNPLKFDQSIIQRVLVNLLFNAMKYSPGGGVVRVAVANEEDGARVSISDQGPGIPEEYMEEIFTKFGQVREKKYQRTGSTGLGLTFCKLAIEAHGGRIGVDSVEGEGSTFWFVLPYQCADKQKPLDLSLSNGGLDTELLEPIGHSANNLG